MWCVPLLTCNYLFVGRIGYKYIHTYTARQHLCKCVRISCHGRGNHGVCCWLAAGGLLSNYNEITGGGGTGGHQRHLGSQHPHLLCSPCSRHMTPDSGDRDENSVFILYIYLFSTFIDLALIRYNKNMLQKTDNPLNIVWCWNNIFVISLYNIFSVYSKYRDRSRKTLPMKHLDSRWKRVTTTGAVCPVAATTAAIFTSVSRWGWQQPLSRVSGGHTAAGQLHIYRQPEGSGIIKSILNTAPSWYLNIARKPA